MQRVIFLINKRRFKSRNIIPPFLVLATNLTVSFLTRFFISYDNAGSVTVPLDNRIPFVPEFIYIYVLAFLQWAICIIAVMIIDSGVSLRFCMGISFGNLLSGIVFILYPTVMLSRPQFSGGGITGELVKFIFAADTPPANIFPSLHCLHSWACMRMLFAVKGVKAPIKILNALFSVLVFLSVLFVKQHTICDIPAGILAFEAGLLIVGIIFSVKNKRKGNELV